MPREVPEIDRLIEQGLTLYGQGDLDGALLQWEKALAIDPDNAQANSYVDYVRANYELLLREHGEVTSEGAPFGIGEDEPEYQIEIQPGEIPSTLPELDAPTTLEPVDEGWTIDDERFDRSTIAQRRPPTEQRVSSQDVTLELEAEEPLSIIPSGTVTIPGLGGKLVEPEGVSFDDATREYAKREPPPEPDEGFDAERTPAPASEFGPSETPSFGQPQDFQTPPGFGSAATGVKQRTDLGFVQPRSEHAKPAGATSTTLPERPRQPSEPIVTNTRTPSSMEELEIDPELTLEPSGAQPAAPRSEAAPRSAIGSADLDDMDLISSLPSPRPAPQVPRIEIDTPLSGAQKSTKDFPQETRKPAFATAKTREMPLDERPSVATSETQDFDSKTTEHKPKHDQTAEIPNMARAALISAPTRDLGLREVAAAKRAVAPAAAREGTRADVVLPFDPIDAQSTEILEDIDEAALANEPKEDQTRRRITTLFEKASQWSSEGDLERAVAAIDLALSEDPNAALAQKLIHRNRETIMSVFQAYLGDLERTPQLARPLHELASAPISPRAAFLLSRIDGMLSIDEILDVCGMPRLEAYRHLCQLFLRGILR